MEREKGVVVGDEGRDDDEGGEAVVGDERPLRAPRLRRRLLFLDAPNRCDASTDGGEGGEMIVLLLLLVEEEEGEEEKEAVISTSSSIEGAALLFSALILAVNARYTSMALLIRFLNAMEEEGVLIILINSSNKSSIGSASFLEEGEGCTTVGAVTPADSAAES